jgi:glycosyltransferase involved in cell wall biosynthesis
VGIVARLSPEKDHALVFRAFEKVLGAVKNIRLLVIGDGAERANLEKLARQLRIDHKVTFTGFRKDIPDLLALLDLFVLCSRTEGMPLTLLEAMAAGKAIVCTSVGGIPGILESEVNGLLIPPEDEAGLAAALRKLIQDRSLAIRLGKQARRDAEQKYSIEKMVGDYETLYLKHVEKR